MSLFYFENEYGQRLDLQDHNRYCLITDTSGFGIEYDSDFVGIGDIFFQNQYQPAQSELKMNLNFINPDAYEKVQTVGNFLVSAKKLYFVYIPNLAKNTEYIRDVALVGFTKNNKVDGVLTYEVDLSAKTLFYTRNQNRFLIEEAEGEMRFNFRWDVYFNDYADRTVTFENDGHVDAPFTLEFNGYVDRPVMEIYQGKTIVERLEIPITVEENEKLIYSSIDGELYIYHVKANGEKENLINLFDLTDKIFFKLLKGTFRIKFTSDTGVMSRIYFNVFKYYKVV